LHIIYLISQQRASQAPFTPFLAPAKYANVGVFVMPGCKAQNDFFFFTGE
jgi:hypothetical protein